MEYNISLLLFTDITENSMNIRWKNIHTTYLHGIKYTNGKEVMYHVRDCRNGWFGSGGIGKDSDAQDYGAARAGCQWDISEG
jgi:hypothetical protein